MKKLLAIIALAFAFAAPAQAGGEVKEKCKDVIGKDGNPVKNKDGSIKQTCKKIKVHKKLEGHEVPTKK